MLENSDHNIFRLNRFFFTINYFKLSKQYIEIETNIPGLTLTSK